MRKKLFRLSLLFGLVFTLCVSSAYAKKAADGTQPPGQLHQVIQYNPDCLTKPFLADLGLHPSASPKEIVAALQAAGYELDKYNCHVEPKFDDVTVTDSAVTLQDGDIAASTDLTAVEENATVEGVVTIEDTGVTTSGDAAEDATTAADISAGTSSAASDTNSATEFTPVNLGATTGTPTNENTPAANCVGPADECAPGHLKKNP